MREKESIIIIGAGAAGLMAAHMLSAGNYPVTIIEARDRAGGRVQTMQPPGFSRPVELGPEFIHGPAPLTLDLLKRAGIRFYEAEGEFLYVEGDHLVSEAEQPNDFNEIKRRLGEVKVDMPVAQFLDTYFASNAQIRESITNFIEGYDLADPKYASTLALKNDWLNQDAARQYRMQNGYGELISYLLSKTLDAGAKFHFGSIATNIRWSDHQVEVNTSSGQYRAAKLIITIPPALFLPIEVRPESIQIEPAIFDNSFIHQFGTGSVTKILMEFSMPFWKTSPTFQKAGRRMPQIGFVLSDESIPTWWTHEPLQDNILTGWLPQRYSTNVNTSTADQLLNTCLVSLANIFGYTAEELRVMVLGFIYKDWSKEPFSRGAYSYVTTQTVAAQRTLFKGVNDTIYFAGEALAMHGEIGTVEAALVSGREVAEKIINNTVT